MGAGARFACELKIDGVACALTYERGVLIRAATRGDGLVGEDITANVRTVARRAADAAAEATRPSLIEVRGEMYFPVKAFDELNEQLLQPNSDRSRTHATPPPGRSDRRTRG